MPRYPFKLHELSPDDDGLIPQCRARDAGEFPQSEVESGPGAWGGSSGALLPRVVDCRDSQSHGSQHERGSVQDDGACLHAPVREARGRLLHRACPPSSDEGISQIGRVEVEGRDRRFVVKSMMLDLVGADRGEQGNPGESAIDAITLEVSEPMRNLEGEIVQKRGEQEHHRRIDR